MRGGLLCVYNSLFGPGASVSYGGLPVVVFSTAAGSVERSNGNHQFAPSGQCVPEFSAPAQGIHEQAQEKKVDKEEHDEQ